MRGFCSLGLGMAPGRRRTPGPRLARRARKTRSVALRFGQAGASLGAARVGRQALSTDSFFRMALLEAAKKKDWEKVQVRRPLEAVSSTEYGPSQAVRLKLGQWTLDAVVARPIRPCCAESSPYVRQF